MDWKAWLPLWGRRRASQLVRTVARDYGYTVSEIVGRGHRDLGVRDARCVAMFLLRDRVGLTYAAIGRAFSGRHPSTVISIVRRGSTLCEGVRDA